MKRALVLPLYHFSPTKPNGHWTNTYYFKGGFAVMVWL